MVNYLGYVLLFGLDPLQLSKFKICILVQLVNNQIVIKVFCFGLAGGLQSNTNKQFPRYFVESASQRSWEQLVISVVGGLRKFVRCHLAEHFARAGPFQLVDNKVAAQSKHAQAEGLKISHAHRVIRFLLHWLHFDGR